MCRYSYREKDSIIFARKMTSRCLEQSKHRHCSVLNRYTDSIILMKTARIYPSSFASSRTPVPKSHALNPGQPIHVQLPDQPTTTSCGVPESAPRLFLSTPKSQSIPGKSRDAPQPTSAPGNPKLQTHLKRPRTAATRKRPAPGWYCCHKQRPVHCFPPFFEKCFVN